MWIRLVFKKPIPRYLPPFDDTLMRLCLKSRTRLTVSLFFSHKEAQKLKKSAEPICVFCASLWHRHTDLLCTSLPIYYRAVAQTQTCAPHLGSQRFQFNQEMCDIALPSQQPYSEETEHC